jgi:hypothetical protein
MGRVLPRSCTRSCVKHRFAPNKLDQTIRRFTPAKSHHWRGPRKSGTGTRVLRGFRLRYRTTRWLRRICAAARVLEQPTVDMTVSVSGTAVPSLPPSDSRTAESETDRNSCAKCFAAQGKQECFNAFRQIARCKSSHLPHAWYHRTVLTGIVKFLVT